MPPLPLPRSWESSISLRAGRRSEEHTSELQSRSDLVCRLLLEKKKKHERTSRRRKRDCSRAHTGSSAANNREAGSRHSERAHNTSTRPDMLSQLQTTTVTRAHS